MRLPKKYKKIMGICAGEGAADKKGGVRADEYYEDLKRMAEEHREMDAAGECFVHIRERSSTNSL